MALFYFHNFIFKLYYCAKGIFKMIKKFIAEAVGTAILVLLGCGTAMAYTFNGAIDGGAAVAISAGFGVGAMIMVYAFGSISGGHANPAVSFAKALNKEITWKEFGIYCGGQVLGAFFGSFLLAMVMWAWGTGNSGATNIYHLAHIVAKHGETGFMTIMLSTMCEMGITFLFVLCVLVVTNKKELEKLSGLIIGFALFGAIAVGIHLTGPSVNPARGLSAIVFSMFDGENVGYKALCLIPAIVGPFMGAFAAWSAYHGFYGKKEAKAE